MAEGIKETTTGLDPEISRIKKEINEEGFESDSPELIEKGAGLAIGTKEEVEQIRKRLESEGRTEDLETYIRLHKEIAVPKDFAAPYLERYDFKKGEMELYDKGEFYFVDSDGNIAKVKVDLNLIDSAKGKVKIEKEGERFSNRRSDASYFIEGELRKIGFTQKSGPGYGALYETAETYSFRKRETEEEKKKEGFNL
jgi:hypothetical protein